MTVFVIILLMNVTSDHIKGSVNDNEITFSTVSGIDVIKNSYFVIHLPKLPARCKYVRNIEKHIIDEIRIYSSSWLIMKYHKDMFHTHNIFRKDDEIIIYPNFFWNHIDIPRVNYNIVIKFADADKIVLGKCDVKYPFDITARVTGRLLLSSDRTMLATELLKTDAQDHQLYNIPYSTLDISATFDEAMYSSDHHESFEYFKKNLGHKICSDVLNEIETYLEFDKSRKLSNTRYHLIKCPLEENNLYSHINGVIIVLKNGSEYYDYIEYVRVIVQWHVLCEYHNLEMLTVLKKISKIELPANYYYIPIDSKLMHDAKLEITFKNITNKFVMNIYLVGTREFFVRNNNMFPRVMS